MGLPFLREMALAITAFAAVGCGSSDSSNLRDQAEGSPAAPSSGGTSGGGGASGSGGAFGSGGASGVPGAGASGNAGVSGSAGQGPTVDAGSPPDSSFVPVPIPPPAPVGCVTTAAAGVHEFACDTTTHIVSVPEQCMTTACGVIVDVHGGSMSADMEDKNTNLRALGRQHGYIVIQPNALPNPLLAGARIFVAGVDDTRVLNILTNVTQAFHADMNRIHMTGFSEGGFMTWRWTCMHSDLLASVAPAAAAWQCTTLPITPEIGCLFSGTEVPTRPIPILFMQGMTDALVNPDCVVNWLNANVFPTLGLSAGPVLAGDATFQRTLYQGPSGVPFEFIQHQYSTDAQFLGVPIVGHCYPGSTDFMPTLPGQLMGFGCKDQVSFNWGEEVIRFFMAHPKR